MNQKITKIILRVIISLLISFELCFFVEIVLMLKWKHINLVVFILLFFIIATIIFFLKISNRGLYIIGVATILFFSICIAVPFSIWRSFSTSAVYEETDFGKEQLYSNHSVLILVPHQDDDFNVSEGVIEEFIKYGSTVRIAFTTNGDSSIPVETRLGEALASMPARTLCWKCRLAAAWSFMA